MESYFFIFCFRSQEQLVESPQPALLRGRGADLRRTQSADELATLDYDMFENRRGSAQTLPMGRGGYTRIQNESRGSVDRTDGGLAMGTVDVAVAGIMTPNGSQDGSSHIYDMAGQQITFTADNGGRNVYTLDNGGYRTDEWYTRGGRGPGQLREEGFQEIHVEHHPIYQEITFNDEVGKIRTAPFNRMKSDCSFWKHYKWKANTVLGFPSTSSFVNIISSRYLYYYFCCCRILCIAAVLNLMSRHEESWALSYFHKRR